MFSHFSHWVSKMEIQEVPPQQSLFCLVGCCCSRCDPCSVRLVPDACFSFQLRLGFTHPFFSYPPSPTSSLHFEFIQESSVFFTSSIVISCHQTCMPLRVLILMDWWVGFKREKRLREPRNTDFCWLLEFLLPLLLLLLVIFCSTSNDWPYSSYIRKIGGGGGGGALNEMLNLIF